MDQETKDFIRDTMRGEIEGLAGMIARGFEHVEAEMGTLRTDVQSLKVDVSQLKTDVNQLKSEMVELRNDLTSVKRTVERIDERTQNQVEALYEEVRVTQRRVERVEDHLGLPHTLVA